MTDPAGWFLVPAGEAELRWLGETSTAFLATGDLTGGRFALVAERTIRGTSVPLHRHADDVESFYVLEGEVTLFVADRTSRLGPGSFAHVSGGVVHGFRIESESARYLILTTPRHGEFYRAITLPSREGGLPPLESVDESQIAEACREYGVEFVGPLPE